MRFLPYLALLFSGKLAACLCSGLHVSLPEAVCYADTSGMLVLEVTLLEVEDEYTGTARIDRSIIGQTDRGELLLSGGEYSSCRYGVLDGSVGARFLLFVDSLSIEQGSVLLHECGYNQSMYRLNEQGTEIEYGYTTESSSGRNVGVRFQPYYADALENSCSGQYPAARDVQLTAIGNLKLSNNPGNGQTSLSVDEGEFPVLRQLDVYRADGRLLTSIQLDEYKEGKPLPLDNLPRGYNIIVVTDGVNRKALPYVRY
jgi:hypothetical protein